MTMFNWFNLFSSIVLIMSAINSLPKTGTGKQLNSLPFQSLFSFLIWPAKFIFIVSQKKINCISSLFMRILRVI